MLWGSWRSSRDFPAPTFQQVKVFFATTGVGVGVGRGVGLLDGVSTGAASAGGATGSSPTLATASPPSAMASRASPTTPTMPMFFHCDVDADVATGGAAGTIAG